MALRVSDRAGLLNSASAARRTAAPTALARRVSAEPGDVVAATGLRLRSGTVRPFGPVVPTLRAARPRGAPFRRQCGWVPGFPGAHPHISQDQWPWLLLLLRLLLLLLLLLELVFRLRCLFRLP